MNFRKIRNNGDHTSGRPPVIRKQTQFALQYFFNVETYEKVCVPCTFLFSPQAILRKTISQSYAIFS